LILLMTLAAGTASAGEDAPWGRAEAQSIDYTPQRVVYDVAAADAEALTGVLDRASYLSTVYGADPFSASIVLVLHGNEIPLFAVENYKDHAELMTRARSLTVGGIIEFRMCEQAARAHGFEPEEIHGFVQIVPMADAEIIQLQQEEGYAYMQ
jgi:intracellular sulfur oxidation DsrE/DsrF family protein